MGRELQARAEELQQGLKRRPARTCGAEQVAWGPTAPLCLARLAGRTSGPGAPGSSREPPAAPSAARARPGKLPNPPTHPPLAPPELRSLWRCPLWSAAGKKGVGEAYEQEGGWQGGLEHPDCEVHAEGQRTCRPRWARSLGAEAGRRAPWCGPGAGKPPRGGSVPGSAGRRRTCA